jgi:type II secretory pathway component PulJ
MKASNSASRGIRRSRSPRGFTLGHLLIALPLLAVFAVVSTQLLRTTWRTSADVRVTAEANARFDTAIHRLRADAWGASGMTAGGTTATLRQPDGRSVVWQMNPASRALVRTVSSGGDAATAPADALSWEQVPVLGFSVEGPALRVSIPDPSAGRTDEMTLISQLMLAGRAQ